MPSFGDDDWKEMAARVSADFGFDAPRAARLEASRTARLVASLPFLAGCAEPERTAMSHLGVFILASSEGCRAAFDHAPRDDRDPLARLAPIGGFQGGDPRVIDGGMALLAAAMTRGYLRDVEADRASGDYNPVGAGVWDAEDILSGLEARAEAARGGPLEASGALDGAKPAFWDD